MAGEVVGKAIYQLESDATGVKKGTAEAEKLIEQSAKKGEASFAKLKKAGMVAGAAVLGAFSVGLVKRFADLERAQADFRQETGATAEEAAKAGKAINAMAGRNLQSIEEIGSALTKVHTDLGLTGEEAERTTESFLKFAQATGQDATGAILAFDDLLDSWGLTAEDSTDIMDKLVEAHQRYGGSIEDNQAALADLAPALKAANLTIDDGIGLLDLFAASGLDASDATSAMTKALGKVKSPEQLKALMDDISGTEDDFKRAEKAAKLFGARAGAKLANALKGVDLDDYKVSMEDAAGATLEAADASLTMADKVKLALGNIVSGAVDMLGENGPLLTAVGSLGTLFAPLLGKAFSGAVGLAKPAIAAAGALAGAIFAGGEALGGGAGTGILGALTRILTTQLPKVLSKLGPLAFLAIPLVTERDDSKFNAARDKVLDDYRRDQERKQAWEHGRQYTEAFLSGVRSYDIPQGENGFTSLIGGDVKPEAEAAGNEVGRAFVTGVFGGMYEANVPGDPRKAYAINFDWWRKQALTTVKAVEDPLMHLTDTFAWAFHDIFTTMNEAKEPWKAAWKNMAEWAKHPFQPDKFEKWLADRAAQATKNAAKAAEEGRPKAAARWARLAKAMSDPMTKMLVEMGLSLDMAVARMIAVDRIAARLAKKLKNLNTGEQYVMGLYGQVPKKAAGGPVQALRPYVVGERGPELFVPRNSGTVLSATQTAAAGGITVNINAPTRPMTAPDIGRQLRRVAMLGAF